MLHEAAHGVASVARAKHVAGDGRLHTVRYAVIAQQLGLRAVQIGDRGMAATTMTPTAQAAYADVIRHLTAVLDTPPPGDFVTTRITVWSRPAGVCIGVAVCPQCEPDSGAPALRPVALG